MRNAKSNRANTLIVAFFFGLALAKPSAAQNLAITNVRIVVGNGAVYENGTIIVRDGKIATVTGGAVQLPPGLVAIDGKGMSAMPGFIDGHKHLNDGPNAKAWMQSLLEAGMTTVLIGGGPADANLALAKKVESGEYNGPRLIPSGAVNLRQTPADARAAIQALAKAGIKYTGEIVLTPEPAPPQAEIETLRAIVDEAKKVGVQVNVHAVSSAAMTVAMDVGVTRLVHLPNKDWTTYEQAEEVAKTGSIVAGLIAFGAPNIDRLSAGPRPCNGQKTILRASAMARLGPRRSPERIAIRKGGRRAPKAATQSLTRAGSGTPIRSTAQSHIQQIRTRTTWSFSSMSSSLSASCSRWQTSIRF